MEPIKTNGLTKRYGSSADGVLAVDDLNLTVEQGEVFGFLGPNGAGKSTTINMILDYIRPTKGNVTVLGDDARDENRDLWKRVGVMPEGAGLYERLTARRHLELACDWKSADDDPDAILDRVGLDKSDASRNVGDFSKGMTQRLVLGMALVGKPDLLILDEPSSGLDPHGIRRMRNIVREEVERGSTVFFSSHILDQVEAVCDRVGILQDGSLVAVDTVDGLREAVGTESSLLIRVDEPVPEIVEDVPGVTACTVENDTLRVTCSSPSIKSKVIIQLAEAGVEILDINAEQASLEDLFTTYTADDSSSENNDQQHPTEVKV